MLFNCKVQVLRNAKVDRFMQAFWGVRQHMYHHLNPLMQEKHNLELSEYFLLLHIHKTDCNPSELAEILQIPPHGISRKLDSLQKLKLISRKLDPQDARKRILSVSKKGETKLQEAQETMNQETHSMLESLNPEELEQLLTLLEKLA